MPAQRPIKDINGTILGYAWGDGTNDDTAVLQAALNSAKRIYVPSGKYKITSTLTVPSGTTTGIVGAGGSGPTGTNVGTIIQASFTTGNAITNSSSNPLFQHFLVTRVGTPTSGSYGLDLGSANATGTVINVTSTRHHKGFFLRATGTATAKGLLAQSNTSDGYTISGKWNITNANSESNGGHGYVATGSYDSGTMSGLASFGNGGSGFYCDTMPNLRLQSCFFGDEHDSAVYIINNNAAGKYNQLTCVGTEAVNAFAIYLGVNTRDNRLKTCYYTKTVAPNTCNTPLYAEGASQAIDACDFSGLASSGASIVLTAGANVLKAVTTREASIGVNIAGGSCSIFGGWLQNATPVSGSATQYGDYQ